MLRTVHRLSVSPQPCCLYVTGVRLLDFLSYPTPLLDQDPLLNSFLILGQLLLVRCIVFTVYSDQFGIITVITYKGE